MRLRCYGKLLVTETKPQDQPPKVYCCTVVELVWPIQAVSEGVAQIRAIAPD
jgi:hypothetical protein